MNPPTEDASPGSCPSGHRAAQRDVPGLRPRRGAHDEKRIAREEAHSAPGVDVPEDVEERLDAPQAFEEAARPGCTGRRAREEGQSSGVQGLPCTQRSQPRTESVVVESSRHVTLG